MTSSADSEAVTAGLEQAHQEPTVVGRDVGEVVAVQPAVDVGSHRSGQCSRRRRR